MAFAPFGFDHPSTWGLSFFHILLFGFCFLIAFLCGTGEAFWRRMGWAVLVQFGLLILALSPIIVEYNSIGSQQPRGPDLEADGGP